MTRQSNVLVQVLFVIFALLFLINAQRVQRNIFGESLEACSSTDTALTGFSRNGFCEQVGSDQGSHLICMNLNSTTGGNFCTVTGQPDWCSSLLPCHDNRYRTCAIRNWCVCQWAFARYVTLSGGCDFIQDIKCNAIHEHVLSSYKSNIAYRQALNCLIQRCNLSMNDDEL